MATDHKLAVPKAATENDTSNQLFRERVRQIPGILRVEEYEDRITGRPFFWIYVRHGDRATETSIYELEAELYQLYQRAYLDVWVRPETHDTEPDPGSDSAAS